jgi:hypothetical protein
MPYRDIARPPWRFEIPAGQGFELRFDMPENTHKALLKGKV